MASKPPAGGGLDDLGSLLDSYQDNQTKKEEPKTPEELWVDKFYAHRAKVLKPALEALGREVEKRGHDFAVVETDFRKGNRAVPDEASIKIVLYLSNEKTRTKINADRRPHLAFYTVSKRSMVAVTICDITSRGGTESKIGEFILEGVDVNFVRDKFVALFKRLVGKT